MRTALVKAIALPAVYRANLECQWHVPFQHSRTRVIDLRTRERRGFCTLVHSFSICTSVVPKLRGVICVFCETGLGCTYEVRFVSCTCMLTEWLKFVKFKM